MMLPLDISDSCFHATYSEAAEAFVDACTGLGLAVHTYPHPLTGPSGEALATRVARAGPADASKLMILISGTHGLEGLAGSGCQIGWLAAGGLNHLPPDTAVLIVHLINPWGCAWRRRQTEDNVDLNRNFCDFSAPLPENPDYDRIHPFLVCPDFDGPSRADALDALAVFRREAGEAAFATALFKGQYDHLDGIGYGGSSPTWSNVTLHRILNDYAQGAQRVAVVDIHTGLGPYGHGMILSLAAPGTPSAARARGWFGPGIVAVNSPDGAVPYVVQGDLCSAIEAHLMPAEATAIALEYGTDAVDRLLGLQIDDCWLHNFGDPHTAIGNAIRTDLLTFFYPATRDWKEAVLIRGMHVIEMALRGLGPAK